MSYWKLVVYNIIPVHCCTKSFCNGCINRMLRFLHFRTWQASDFLCRGFLLVRRFFFLRVFCAIVVPISRRGYFLSSVLTNRNRSSLGASPRLAQGLVPKLRNRRSNALKLNCRGLYNASNDLVVPSSTSGICIPLLS